MTEKDSMAKVKSVAESIPNAMKAYAKHPLVADFVDAVFEAVGERASKIEKDDASNVDTIYCLALANILEVFVINIDRLLANKGTVAHLNFIVYFLWVVWSSLDVAMNLYPGRLAWDPPVKFMEIVEAMRKELVQSAV